MGAEFDGNFADVFDDLKSLVFDVDGAEADRLGLAQDAGDSERMATNSGLSLPTPQRRPRTPQPANVEKRILIRIADSILDFSSRGCLRRPSGLGERVRPRAHNSEPSRGGSKKLRPKAGGVFHVGREAHPTAPEGLRLVAYGSGSGRAPREEAAKIAILKSITLETLV